MDETSKGMRIIQWKLLETVNKSIYLSLKVIDKKITTTDTAIHFKKLKTLKVSYEQYNAFLEDIAKTKKVELSEIKNKLANCGAPGTLHTTVSLYVHI